MVDLQKEAIVNEVAVTNRPVKAHRLMDFVIRVGNTKAYEANQFCFQHASNAIPGATTFHKCTNSVHGRYLYIEQHVREAPLSVCEVVVFGYYLN